MKKKLAILILSFVMILVFLSFNASARTVLTNLCDRDDIEVTWSGTWQHAGTDGTDNPGTNLVDGDYYNKWGSNDIYSTKEEWVQIAWPEEVAIHSFQVCQESSGAYTNIQQYTLQIQDENEEWITVYTSPLFEEFWIEDTGDFDEPVITKAIRFHCTDEQAAPGSHTAEGQCAVELSEIEFFEKTEVEDTPTPEPTPTATVTNTPEATYESKGTNDDGSILPIILVAAGIVVVATVVIFTVNRAKKSKS